MENNKSIKDPISTKDHCAYCFDVLLAQLNKKQLPEFPSNLERVSCPLFVTWNTEGDDLRGCIGTFSPKPISQLLQKYALTSAFKDDRFEPISIKEVPSLSVCVSLLKNFEKAKDAYDWEVGKHGIEIFFEIDNEDYSATFLPEVALEWKWTKEQTLKELIRKAGLKS